MPALFPPWTNTALRLGLLGAGASIAAVPVLLCVYVRTPWNTGEFDAVGQPVEFDHRHHVVDDEIECLYCHSEAERSAFAGVPSTAVCMGCHVQIWNESPLLEPVRQSLFTGQSLRWNRVHDVPDFVYFDHSVHVQRGIGCVHCHGRVDAMARVYKAAPLSMQWCLDCHRNPLKTIARVTAPAPVSSSYSSLWGKPRGEYEHTLANSGHAVTSLTTCSACHR